MSPLGTVTGAEAIIDQDRLVLIAFPDRRVTAHSWVEEGDTVVVEGEWTGTHSGPLTLPDGSQLPPTGQQVTYATVGIWQVKDGKTVARRLYYDQMPVAMQLGLVAPTQQP